MAELANGAGAGPRITREAIITKYEAQLFKAKWAARAVGSLHAFCRFLALCSLTFASVMLLGAFVSFLAFEDYAFIVSLLLLEATRLASSAFFTDLLTHTLAQLSQNPNKMEHEKDFQYRRAGGARLVSFCLQALLISPGFVLPILRLLIIDYEQHNLQASLLIFYILIITNASISLFTLISSSIAFMCFSEESILSYYDEILQNTLRRGVVGADDFEFFGFVYRLLGKRYASNVQPKAIVHYHKELIRYIYAHRHGVDTVMVYLDAEDVFVQQAAANMVGFWADHELCEFQLMFVKLPPEMLTKLADKVGFGQVGWAASNSFGGVATRDPGLITKTMTSSGKFLLHKLAELVDVSTARSLTFVRTLVLYYNNPNSQEPLPSNIQEDLVLKLKQMLKEMRVHRLRVQSAYLLHLLGKLDPSCYPLIKRIDPHQDFYWFNSELEMLKFLVKDIPQDADDSWNPNLDLAEKLRNDRPFTPRERALENNLLWNP